MTTKKDDVKETKEWVSSELDKLRMKGVRVLPQPLVEVNTTASAKRTFRRGGESNRIRIEKKKHITKKSTNKDPITKISQMLHKKWLEGTWKGIDRLKLKDILEKFDETNLATLKDRLRKLNMPTNDKELHIISTYVLDVSDNETKVSSNEYSAHKLKRWAEEWTCPAPPVSESESPEFLHYMFSSIDRNISTLPEELANLCKTDHEVKVITPSRQAELLSRLGLSAHSLETSISTSDFVSKWIENQGISKTSLLSQLDSARCAVAMWRHINQDAISYSRGTKTPSVYLGGRDQGSSWREDIAIPLLRTMNIAYNDPTLFEDLPDRVSLRLRARERSRVRLYVVEEGRDLATLIEATSQIASGHSTCVVVIPSSSSSTSKGWNRAMGYLAAVASSQGVKVFTRIKAAVFEAVRIVEEDGDDEKDEQEEIKLTIKSPIKDASEAVDMKLLRNERYNNNNNNNNTDELERLREENDTLKTELGALDDDFFADIEDLKSRYDRAIRRIEHLDHKLRDERNEERGLRRRHESVWDTMSEQLYEADRETSGHLAPRDFRRIVCRNLGLEREEARKLVESLPSDVYGCVNFVAFLDIGRVLHGSGNRKRHLDGTSYSDDEDVDGHKSKLSNLSDVEMKLERMYASGLWKGLTKEQIRQAVGQTSSSASSSSASTERIPSSVLKRGLRRLVQVCDVPLDESEQDCIVSALSIGGTNEDYVSVSRWYQMFEVWPYQKDLRKRRNKHNKKTGKSARNTSSSSSHRRSNKRMSSIPE